MTRKASTRRVRAAVYLRISLDATGEGLAVERQEQDCVEIARRRGWKVVKTYTDNSISAYDKAKRRPAYDQMRDDYDRNEFDALVCWDLDRLTRQPRQLEDWFRVRWGLQGRTDAEDALGPDGDQFRRHDRRRGASLRCPGQWTTQPSPRTPATMWATT